MCIQGNTPTDLYLNVNYGLNADGTVKDDDASRAWQEVIQDLRFRQAIAMSIDAEEILDTVYHNLGAVREGTLCTNDVEAANALLDEIGMKDVDGDGYRESPSGLPFSFQIWNAAEASDIVPTTELYVEYLAEIGIRATGYTTESTLLEHLYRRQRSARPLRVGRPQHHLALWRFLQHRGLGAPVERLVQRRLP